MENSPLDMIDMAFELKGSLVPAGYPFALWQEVMRILPWLDAEEFAGIVPLRGSENDEGVLLAKRSRLVLRLPGELASQAMALSGQDMKVDSCLLQVGAVSKRPLQPHPTLHANLVESDDEEEGFLTSVSDALIKMNIACNWICGKRHTLSGTGRSLNGYSLVLHDLKPEDSLQIQRAGLGANRRYGCGIFVPYKAISGLN